VNHSLTQIFCAGLPLRLKESAFVGCTVILENERMIHRDIRSSLFEVSYRITPRGHYIAQQLVGIRHGSAGAVNESCLYFRPRVDKPRTIALSQLSDVQGLHPISSLVQYRFCFPLAPTFFHGAGILSTAKLSAQSYRSALANKEPNANTYDDQHRNSKGYIRGG
jgi:hypothetical protein